MVAGGVPGNQQILCRPDRKPASFTAVGTIRSTVTLSSAQLTRNELLVVIVTLLEAPDWIRNDIRLRSRLREHPRTTGCSTLIPLRLLSSDFESADCRSTRHWNERPAEYERRHHKPTDQRVAAERPYRQSASSASLAERWLNGRRSVTTPSAPKCAEGLQLSVSHSTRPQDVEQSRTAVGPDQYRQSAQSPLPMPQY
jgi:hypothetical protein